MSVDRRIREGLARIASEVEVDPVPALQVVQGRARRQTRVLRSAQVLAVAVVTALAVLGAPTALERFRHSGEPAVVNPAAPLVGTYVIDVADTATNRRAGVLGRWVVTFRPDGVVDLTAPKAFTGSRSGSTYRVRGDTLRTDALVASGYSPGCQAAGGFVGTYRWARDSAALRFTLVSDTCPARIALFTGQLWEVAS